MRTIVLLSALFSIGFAVDSLYPFPDCYAKGTTRCSSVEPAAGAWSYISYCPTKSLWLSIPCNQYPGVIADNHCSLGYLWYPATFGKEMCIPKRELVADEKSEIESNDVEERAVYNTCPLTGSAKVVCCPTPKGCHTSAIPASACF